MTHVAFLGLGNMGLPMARNLVKAGHDVQAFDVFAPARDKAAQAGLKVSGTLAEAVKGAGIVVTSLPGDTEVLAVYADVRAQAGAGALFIDTSTVAVTTARQLSGAARDAGCTMIDAPVSGGVAGAEAGTLTFMVGGAAADVARAAPLLQAMGKAVIHCGPSGNGEAAKLCNNMLLGVQMIGVAEAFLLGEKLGLEPQKLFDVVKQSTTACWSITVQNPVAGIVETAPSSRGYTGGFATALALKDLKLAQRAAQDAGAPTPLGAAATALYALHAATPVDGQDSAKLDFSAIYRMLKGKA